MRVANEITDSLLMADLTVRQLKVMLAIMQRHTDSISRWIDSQTDGSHDGYSSTHCFAGCQAPASIERKFLIADGVKIGGTRWFSVD